MFKKCFVVVFVLCLGLGSSAWGNTDWVGGGINTLWSTAGNWDNGVPASNVETVVDTATSSPLIDSSVTAVCEQLWLSYSASDATLNMTGGTLTTTWNLYQQVYNNKTGIFNLSGGIVTVPYYDYMSCFSSGTSYLDMTGGTFDIGGSLLVGGYTGSGTSNAFVNLDGGTINCNTIGNVYICPLWIDNALDHVNITHGVMYLDGGDWSSNVAGYITAGTLTGYGSADNVRYSFDGTNTEVWAAPEPASMLLLGLGGLTFLKRRK